MSTYRYDDIGGIALRGKDRKSGHCILVSNNFIKFNWTKFFDPENIFITTIILLDYGQLPWQIALFYLFCR